MKRQPHGEEELKRYDVWLNERHQETLAYFKKLRGDSAATTIRAGLELLRRKTPLDAER